MMHTAMVLEGTQYILFVFRSCLAIVIDGERERWRMCEHVLYRYSVGTEKMKVQAGWWQKYELPPALADLCQLVPPTLAGPMEDMAIHRGIKFFVLDVQLIEIEYVKKHVVVEDMDSPAAGHGGLYWFVDWRMEQER
jgi:hypothetical protein